MTKKEPCIPEQSMLLLCFVKKAQSNTINTRKTKQKHKQNQKQKLHIYQIQLQKTATPTQNSILFFIQHQLLHR